MEITKEIITTFREAYPEFEDVDVFSDGFVARQLKAADNETGSNRWGGYSEFSIKQEGMFLFAAHILVKRRECSYAVKNHVNPYPSGPPKSIKVGDEKIEYGQTIAAADYDISHDLVSTIYGAEFVRLRQRVTMGARVAGRERWGYSGMYPGYGTMFWPYYVT